MCLSFLRLVRRQTISSLSNPAIHSTCIPIHTSSLSPISNPKPNNPNHMLLQPHLAQNLKQDLVDLVSTGNCSDALYLFVKMRSLILLDVDTINQAIHSYSQSNHLNYAFSLLGSILKLGFLPNHSTYHALLKGLVYENKYLESDFLFNKLIRWKEIKPDFMTYHSISQALPEYIGDLTSFSRAISQALPEYIGDLTSFSRATGLLTYLKLVIGYDALIIGYCKMQDCYTALDLFKEMMSIPLTPLPDTYNSILQALYRVGDYFTADDICLDMKKKGVGIEYKTFEIRIDCVCKYFGCFASALRVLHFLEFHTIQMRIDVYNCILDHMMNAGEIDEAIDLFDYICDRKRVEPNATTYTTMIIGLSNEGLLDDAFDLLADIESSDYLHDFFKAACLKFLEQSLSPDLLQKIAAEFPDTRTCHSHVSGSTTTVTTLNDLEKSRLRSYYKL